jgi:uncharacterized phage protein (TIGR01671 family)
MSREIKFRAWDDANGQMIPNEHCDVLLKNVNNVGRYANHHLHYMQFTGLQDKKGKDIYEGDIVIIKNSIFVKFDMDSCETTDDIPEVYEDSESEIVFSDGAFCVTEPNTDTHVPINIYDTNDIGVIGNIYESPNMLNSEPNPDECDATEADSKENAGLNKKNN